MNPRLFDAIDRFAVYVDEVGHGFLSLARMYRWAVGEPFHVDLQGGKELPKVVTGDKCRIIPFTNAAKSVHYMHVMAQTVIQDIVDISKSPLEQWLDDDEIGPFKALTTDVERHDFLSRAGVIKERGEWELNIDEARVSAGIVLSVTSELMENFVTVTGDVKYRGEVDNKDIKKYMERNKKLDCR